MTPHRPRVQLTKGFSPIGMGNSFAPLLSSATYGVAPTDAGIASAMVNTRRQVGGSIGTALLSSILASAVSSFAEGNPPSPQVAADAAGVFAFGAIVVGSLMRSIKIEVDAPAETRSEAHLARS